MSFIVYISSQATNVISTEIGVKLEFSHCSGLGPQAQYICLERLQFYLGLLFEAVMKILRARY